MSGLIFVDTNVFLYAQDRGVPDKQRQAQTWREALWRTRRGRISFQVLQEFYSQACRINPDCKEAARAEINDLLSWDPITCDEPILLAAFVLQDRFQLSFWDSLIVAAAQAASCQILLTEDLQHGQNLGGVKIANPFRVSPGDVGL